jgi:hypothetical protein
MAFSENFEQKVLSTTPDESTQVWSARTLTVIGVLLAGQSDLSKEQILDHLETLAALAPAEVMIDSMAVMYQTGMFG